MMHRSEVVENWVEILIFTVFMLMGAGLLDDSGLVLIS